VASRAVVQFVAQTSLFSFLPSESERWTLGGQEAWPSLPHWWGGCRPWNLHSPPDGLSHYLGISQGAQVNSVTICGGSVHYLVASESKNLERPFLSHLHTVQIPGSREWLVLCKTWTYFPWRKCFFRILKGPHPQAPVRTRQLPQPLTWKCTAWFLGRCLTTAQRQLSTPSVPWALAQRPHTPSTAGRPVDPLLQHYFLLKFCILSLTSCVPHPPPSVLGKLTFLSLLQEFNFLGFHV
jgi:hypothetical protein